MVTRLRTLLNSVFRRAKMERDMAEELRLHIELRARDLARTGVSQVEAERRARLEFGPREAFQEQCREARGLRLLDELRQDLRYALRTLKANPGFAAVAILSLALGIGANAAIFSLLDAVILKSLPVASPNELFVIREVGKRPSAQRFSYALTQRFAQAITANASLAAMSRINRLNTLLKGEQQSTAARGQLVSGGYFNTLGLSPQVGRLLTAEDNRDLGGHPVAVISHGFWERRFAASPS